MEKLCQQPCGSFRRGERPKDERGAVEVVTLIDSCRIATTLQPAAAPAETLASESSTTTAAVAGTFTHWD
jgi:hypothetical protein